MLEPNVQLLKAEECHYPNIIAEMQKRNIDFEEMTDIMQLENVKITRDILVFGKNKNNLKVKNMVSMMNFFEKSPDFKSHEYYMIEKAAKSEKRINLEKRIEDFIQCIKEVNRLGDKIGRDCLALDIIDGLRAFVIYADNGTLEEITGLPSGKKITATSSGKLDTAVT